MSNLKLYPVIKKRKVCGCSGYRGKLEKDPLVLTYSTIGLFYEFVFRGIKQAREQADGFNLPILFLHGTKDNIISVESTVEIFRKVSSQDKTLKIYNGLYHELLQEQENDRVIKDILSWLNNKIDSSIS